MSKCGDCPCWVKERCTEDLTNSECIDKLQDSLWEYSNEFGQRAEPKQEWIPCSEGMPKRSYSRRFWLTVKLDDERITTLIGRWSAFSSINGDKTYDAFDCWKDVMINGNIIRMAQPIPKEQVLAWMPLPEPWEGADDE